MERRRVQEVGGGTVTVSLPHSWAEEHDVSAGTEIIVKPHLDGSLELRLTEPATDVFGTLTLQNGDESAVVDGVRAAFEAGYEQIVVDRSDSQRDFQSREVAAVVRALPGIEVTEEDDGKIVIKGILETASVSILQTLRQIHYTLTRLQDRVRDALENGAVDLEPLIERRQEIHRRVRQIDRHFIRALIDPEEMDALGEPRFRLYQYTRIAERFDRAAAELVELARLWAYSGDHDSRTWPLLKLHEHAIRTLEDGSKAALNGNPVEEILSVLRRQSDLQDQISTRLSELIDSGDVDPRTIASLTHITALGDCGGRIADISLQMAIGIPSETDSSMEHNSLDLSDSRTTDYSGVSGTVWEDDE